MLSDRIKLFNSVKSLVVSKWALNSGTDHLKIYVHYRWKLILSIRAIFTVSFINSIRKMYGVRSLESLFVGVSKLDYS